MANTKITNEQFPVRLTGDDLRDLVHGADWHWAFQLFEDDNVTAKDTTGWTCTVELLESENGEVYATFTNSSGVTMTAASGLFNIDISDTNVDTYNFKSCIFKVIMTDDTGDKTPYFLGTLKFAQV